MYLPYFRGRQYELLALRELADNKLLGSNIIPIVEPVKISATFNSTMEAFAKTNLRIGIIFNPAVGDLSKDDNIVNKLHLFLDGERVIPSVLVDKKVASCLQKMEAAGVYRKNTLAILTKRDFLDEYEKAFSSNVPIFTMFPDDRKIRHTVKNGKILFEDKFEKKSRNADYPEDEFFSDDHLYYSDDGYQGFSDYSIVGNEYTESSFAPYAVAIHIVYFDRDKALRIRHFISDSNEDTSDVAGKFSEALAKLESWYRGIAPWQSTRGLQTFLRHFSNGTYPGLPTLKKLSVMHHLELIGKYLDGETEI
jgi:hypothetical protein